MIPRKEAERLLGEVRDRLEPAGDAFGPAAVLDACDYVVTTSDLVLRGAENVEQKARRYLAEGRVQVRRVLEGGGLVYATARGSDGTEYDLGYDPAGAGAWRCKCPAKARCAHLAALQLIVPPRTPRGAR